MAEEHLLLLVRQLQHVHALGLRPPQYARLRQLAQCHGDLVRRGHARLASAHKVALLDRPSKLLEENWQRAEASGTDKVEERPELLQVVLDGRAGEDDAVGCAEALRSQRDVRVRVADLLALVKDDHDPGGLHEFIVRDAHGFVGSNQYALLGGSNTDGLLPCRLIHLVHDADPKGWVPQVELIAPLTNERRRGHDEYTARGGGGGTTQGGVLHTHGLKHTRVVQHSEVRDNLHGLAQAHLIR
mmetsp:Transcript_20486/g.64524  ORF Transcript_20486/g.64524 Transcript_20486/m.64524 type:complete len:243 (-) Transcript_20486:1056-1784(-)